MKHDPPGRPDPVRTRRQRWAVSSHAAREVDLLPGQVSAAIKRLEAELGIRLFARSTRSLRLTAEGEQYLPYAIGLRWTRLREGGERLQLLRYRAAGALPAESRSALGHRNCDPDTWLTWLPPAAPRLVLIPIARARLYPSGDQATEPSSTTCGRTYAFAATAASATSLSFIASVARPWTNRRVLVARPGPLPGPPCSRPLCRGRPGRARACTGLHDDTAALYDKWRFGDGDRRRRTVAVLRPLAA